MQRIILSGCCGKMGSVVSKIVSETEGLVIAAGIDVNKSETGYPVYSSFADFEGKADVIIDFSHPDCLSDLLDYAVKSKTPAVIATTGHNNAQIEKINAASEKIPVFYSANMSLGVNLLIELVKKSAAVLGKSFDIEIIEKHHNQKIDAPSGTALMIAEAASSSLPFNADYVYDRHSQRKKRGKNEIGIHALRGGTIVGEHEIIFAGQDEIISISHSAMSKDIFAVGAVNAALFLMRKGQGLYNMQDLVTE